MSQVNAQFLENVLMKPKRVLPVGTSKTLTLPEANGRTYGLDSAAGSTLILPAAVGSGAEIEIVVTVTATSNSHKIQVSAGSTDIIQGIINQLSDAGAAMLGWIAGASDDTITFNRTTTGLAAVGHFVRLKDIKNGVWAIIGSATAASGTEATPFSAAV